MKGFYRLLNYEFNHMLKAVLLSCIGVIISPLMLLNLATKESRLSYERFEQIYVSSGCVIVFLIFLAALCAFFLKNFY
ncbi:MAG: hypothetical protein K0R67_2066, partial [Paenibacillus sp.]|nr:hypothetical protein [Paenibacillus sp.]